MDNLNVDVNRILDDRFSLFSEVELLEHAKDFICYFFAENFVGLSDVNNSLITNIVDVETISAIKNVAFDQLSFGSINLVQLIRRVEYLFLAVKAITFRRREDFNHAFWHFRILHVWSMVTEERCCHLKNIIDQILINLDSLLDSSEVSQALKIEYHLEKACFLLQYFEHQKAKQCIDKALELSGLEVELIGALGKRTRFQHKSLPQLSLKVFTHDKYCVGSSLVDEDEELPLNCSNQDDTLLQSVIFDGFSEEEVRKFSKEQVACILAVSFIQRKSSAFCQDLDFEIQMVFIDEVLKQKSAWYLQLRALIERSSLEMNEKRRVERACSQMEVIAKLINCHGCNSHLESAAEYSRLIRSRLEFAFCSHPMPFWSVAKLYARILLSLGCTSEALRTFESFHEWDAVIDCYKRLGQLDKAEKLVRDLIDRKASPLHYCILGDITNNQDYYHKAIEISGDQCARAHTLLAFSLIRNKNYKDAIGHYQRSVQIQPFQMDAWFNLGFSAMKIEDHNEAIRAYHRCVSFEPQHFEAWNNLAASYVSTGQKSRAQKVLLEALKLNYENIRVWENLLFISTEIGDFSTAINAVNRLLNLCNKKPVDEFPLEIMAIELMAAKAIPESDQVEICIVKKKLLETLARVNSQQTLSYKMIKLYADLKKPADGCRDLGQWSIYTDLLQKAYRKEFEQTTTKTEDEESWSRLLEFLFQLVNEMIVFWKIQEFDEAKTKIHIKLLVSSTISRIKQLFGNHCENSQSQSLKKIFFELSNFT